MPGTSLLASFSPSSEQLEAILLSRRGELRETPYRLLLLAIGLGEKTAVLRLRRNQLRKDVLFESGAAVDCHSNIATETIGRFLVSSGRLSEEDHRAALQMSASRQVHIEEVLTERQLLTPSELYRALQQSLGRKLLEPFSWTSGTWEISYDMPPTQSALRVRVPQLLVTGTLKVEPQEVVDRALAGLDDSFLAPGAQPLFGNGELRVTAEQQRVLDAAQRQTRVRDLAAAAQVHPDEIARIVCSLALLGLVVVSESPVPVALELDLPPGEEPRPIDRRVARVERRKDAQEEEGPPAAPAAAGKEEVIAAYLAFRRKDPFDLFGLESTATPAEVARAYVEFAERFLPSRFDQASADSVRDKAQEVFLAGARAYSELADPIRRETLIQNRMRKAENVVAAAQDAAARADSTASRRQLIDPEALWREGRALAAKGKMREALSNFELAADCDAQNATYAAEVAYCRFQLLISPAPVTLKALKNAIRLDSRCAVAYLYAGRVQKTIGNELEGQAYIDRAERLMPSLRQ